MWCTFTFRTRLVHASAWPHYFENCCTYDIVALPSTSSSSIGTATLVGFVPFNYCWVFSAGWFLQSAVASARQTPNLEDQWLERSNSRHQVSLTFETTRANPSSGRWTYGREIAENFARSGDFHVIFGVLLHAVNLRHGTDGFTSLPKEGALRSFSPEKSDGIGRVWNRELGYQRPARLLAILIPILTTSLCIVY